MQVTRISKHVKMLQLSGRDEWLQYRASRIGGSDAAAVVGLNPYKSNIELWEEKKGLYKPEDISNKPYVRYGTEAEEHLRALFRLDFPDYKVGYMPDNMFLNDRFPWAHASLDGWLEDPDGRMGVWECKTTNILQSMAKEKWKDRIPDNYYCQILHYLMVTEFDFVILKAQLKREFPGELPRIETRHYLFERKDVQQDIDYLEDAERKFCESLDKDKAPALLLPEI